MIYGRGQHQPIYFRGSRPSSVSVRSHTLVRCGRGWAVCTHARDVPNDIFRKLLTTHFFSLAFNVHQHLRDFCTAPMVATCNRRTINLHTMIIIIIILVILSAFWANVTQHVYDDVRWPCSLRWLYVTLICFFTLDYICYSSKMMKRFLGTIQENTRTPCSYCWNSSRYDKISQW